MKLSLELVPVVRTDRVNPERELFRDVIDEVDGTALIVAWINLQGPDPGGFVDGGVLEPLDRFSLGTNEFQELDVNLDVVSLHLLLIPLGWNSSNGIILREAIHPIASKDLVDPSSGNPGGVIAH
jgi:hypothetical protein